MSKVPFEQLSIQVDRLYDQLTSEATLETLDKHIMDIKRLIENAGWTEEQYIRMMMFGPDMRN